MGSVPEAMVSVSRRSVRSDSGFGTTFQTTITGRGIHQRTDTANCTVEQEGSSCGGKCGPSVVGLVQYSEVVPCFLTPMLHRTRVTLIGPHFSEQLPVVLARQLEVDARDPLMTRVKHSSGEDAVTHSDGKRRGVAVLEWTPSRCDEGLELPAGQISGEIKLALFMPLDYSTRAVISLHLAAHIPHAEEWPSDASRGLEVPPAAVKLFLRQTLVNDSQCQGWGEDAFPASCTGVSPVYTAYSHGTLLDLPIVDLSMPFNVIAFNSTLWALLIGSAMSLLTRRPLLKKRRRKKKKASPLVRLRSWLTQRQRAEES